MHKFIGLFAFSATLFLSSCSPTVPAPQEEAVKVEAVSKHEQIGIGTALNSENILITGNTLVLMPNNSSKDKGDYFYLDKTHMDHLEVFDKAGKSKTVLNLNGTVNAAKADAASGRTISHIVNGK
jgi:hypothetical protein